jgi:hypothetical protein
MHTFSHALDWKFQFKKVWKMQNLGNVYIFGSPFLWPELMRTGLRVSLTEQYFDVMIKIVWC